MSMTFDPKAAAKKAPAKKKATRKKAPTKAKAAADAPKATRTRATAAEATKSTRRRRNNIDGSSRGKLSLDMSKLDTENFQYRWVEDRPGRLSEVTQQDDYDIVENTDGSQDSVSEGSDVRRPSGPQGMVLVRKPIEFYRDDQRDKVKRVKATTSQLKKGGDAAQQLGADHYIPSGGISIPD